jgi:hypothetical protein
LKDQGTGEECGGEEALSATIGKHQTAIDRQRTRTRPKEAVSAYPFSPSPVFTFQRSGKLLPHHQSTDEQYWKHSISEQSIRSPYILPFLFSAATTRV